MEYASEISQSRFDIVSHLFLEKCMIHDIRFTCILLHNVIIEDEHNVEALVIVGREVTPLDVGIA